MHQKRVQPPVDADLYNWIQLLDIISLYQPTRFC